MERQTTEKNIQDTGFPEEFGQLLRACLNKHQSEHPPAVIDAILELIKLDASPIVEELLERYSQFEDTFEKQIRRRIRENVLDALECGGLKAVAQRCHTEDELFKLVEIMFSVLPNLSDEACQFDVAVEDDIESVFQRKDVHDDSQYISYYSRFTHKDYALRKSATNWLLGKALPVFAKCTVAQEIQGAELFHQPAMQSTVKGTHATLHPKIKDLSFYIAPIRYGDLSFGAIVMSTPKDERISSHIKRGVNDIADALATGFSKLHRFENRFYE